jgi:uncharacterized protein (TIGR02145 family)
MKSLVNTLERLILVILLSFFLDNIKAQQTDTFSDPRDGKTYKTVKIGNQIWMAENLNFETKDSWCLGNDSSKCKQNGRLYPWEDAIAVCPAGWHLPSKNEYETLLTNVGGKESCAYNSLKKGGNSGFSAQFIGYCYGGCFCDVGMVALFWSSTDSFGDDIIFDGWCLELKGAKSTANLEIRNLLQCFSVRCLKNN